MKPFDHLKIDIIPSFEPRDRYAIIPINDINTGHSRYLLKYECHIGGKPKKEVKGQIQLSQAQIESLSQFCTNLNIALMPLDNEMWLDGTTTTVNISQGGNIISFSWQRIPEPWKPIEALIEMVRAIVENAIGSAASN
jgi:hypothetical protein